MVKIKVAHICDDNCKNWGEQVITKVTEKLFEYAGKKADIEFEFEVIAEPTSIDDIKNNPVKSWSRNIIDYINTKDFLLIGGGGAIDFLIERKNCFIDFLEHICIPYIIYSVGWNAWYNSELRKLSYPQIETLEVIKKNALFFSFREDGSTTELAKFGFDDSNSIKTHDVAVWVDKFWSKLTPQFKERYVIISFAGTFPNHRYGMEVCRIAEIQNRVIDFARMLVEKKGYHVVFLSHRPFDTFESFMGEHSDKIHFISWDKLFYSPIEYGLSLYKYASFVIAFRGHAGIISFSYKVPFVTISTMPKLEEFSKIISNDSNCFRIDDLDGAQNKILNFELFSLQSENKFKDTYNQFWSETDHQLDEIMQIIKENFGKNKWKFIKIIHHKRGIGPHP